MKMFAERLREKFAFFHLHLQERLTKDAQGETFLFFYETLSFREMAYASHCQTQPSFLEIFCTTATLNADV
jgi:hypothetical protein